MSKRPSEGEESRDEKRTKVTDETPSGQEASATPGNSNSSGRKDLDRWIGRVALVTGASSGIGASLCRTLVQHGMKVVGCSRNVDRIKAIAEEDAVKEAPGKLTAIKCDLTNESDILSTFEEIRKTFGLLDICINNAGLGNDAPLLSFKTADFKNMLESISPGIVQTEFFDIFLKDNPAIKPSDVFHNNPLQTKDIADTVLNILSTPKHVEVHDIIVRPYSY